MHSHGPGGGLPPPPTRPTATHTHIINPVVGCHYFPPGPQLPSQPSGITALRPVPSYTAWWQRHIGVKYAQSFYAVVPGRDSNPRPLDRESDTLPQHHDTSLTPRPWRDRSDKKNSRNGKWTKSKPSTPTRTPFWIKPNQTKWTQANQPDPKQEQTLSSKNQTEHVPSKMGTIQQF